MNNIKSKKNINHLKCFICGGAFCYLFSQKDFIYFISKKYFDLYECDSCKLVKILPEPTLDEIKSFYPKTTMFTMLIMKNHSLDGFITVQ